MAEEQDINQQTDDSDKQNDAPKKSSKKKLIIIVSVILIIIISGISAFFLMKAPALPTPNNEQNVDASIDENFEGKTIEEQKETLFFYDLDEFIVNLSRVSGQPSFMKIAITFELKGEDNVSKLEAKMPIIKDTLQTYLRELRAEDLDGSVGIFLLKQELLLRINKVLYPIAIRDVLFRDLLIQ